MGFSKAYSDGCGAPRALCYIILLRLETFLILVTRGAFLRLWHFSLRGLENWWWWLFWWILFSVTCSRTPSSLVRGRIFSRSFIQLNLALPIQSNFPSSKLIFVWFVIWRRVVPKAVTTNNAAMRQHANLRPVQFVMILTMTAANLGLKCRIPFEYG